MMRPVGDLIQWPEPRQDAWTEAVAQAAALARAYFTEQSNQAALKRLPRAVLIAEV